MVLKLHMWAGQIGFVGAFAFFLGGIVTFFYPNSTSYAAYCLCVGVLIAPFLFPIKQLGPLLLLFEGNFFFSAGLLAALSIVGFLSVPTTLGSIILCISAIMFIIAGFRKEKSENCEKYTGNNKGEKRGGGGD